MSPAGGARDRALDVFRGATVAAMILVNNPGSWAHLYPPLAHAPWHGCTPTDLVFPFFLFAVGHALALTAPGLLALPTPVFGGRLLKRAGVIFGVGLFLNASPFVRWDAQGELVWRSIEQLRIMGVLQRIALAWLLAALCLRVWGLQRALVVAATLLLAYWALCLGLAAPGTDPYSLEGFVGTALDRTLLGPTHLYRGEGVPFDPEGLFSTLPAVAQVLLGVAVGRWVHDGSQDPRLLGRLCVAACGLLALGYAWQWVMPLNKKIWTSSYVLVTTGGGTLLLACLIHGLGGPIGSTAPSRAAALATSVAEAFGRNALLLFVLSGFVPRVLALLRWPDGIDAQGQPRWITPFPALYREVFAAGPWDPRLASLAFALVQVALYAALAVWLHRRRWYWRA